MYTKHRICRYLRLTIKRNTTAASAIALAHCVFNGNILRNVLPAATVSRLHQQSTKRYGVADGHAKNFAKEPLAPTSFASSDKAMQIAAQLLAKICASPTHTHRSHAAVINCLKSTVPNPTPKCVRFTKQKTTTLNSICLTQCLCICSLSFPKCKLWCLPIAA